MSEINQNESADVLVLQNIENMNIDDKNNIKFWVNKLEQMEIEFNSKLEMCENLNQQAAENYIKSLKENVRSLEIIKEKEQKIKMYERLDQQNYERYYKILEENIKLEEIIKEKDRQIEKQCKTIESMYFVV